MRALMVFVAGLFIFVAYAAATHYSSSSASHVLRTTPVTLATPATSSPSQTDAPPTQSVITESVAAQPPVPGPVAAATTRNQTPAGVIAEGLTVNQAAARIAGSRGRPSIVLLYGTQCPLTQRMFGDFVELTRRHPEVDILAFGTDEELAAEVPDFLKSHGASFAPIYIRDWEPGALSQAMAPLGINAGATWVRPLVAVRDADGRVVAQAQGVTDVAAVEQVLARLR